MGRLERPERYAFVSLLISHRTPAFRDVLADRATSARRQIFGRRHEGVHRQGGRSQGGIRDGVGVPFHRRLRRNARRVGRDMATYQPRLSTSLEWKPTRNRERTRPHPSSLPPLRIFAMPDANRKANIPREGCGRVSISCRIRPSRARSSAPHDAHACVRDPSRSFEESCDSHESHGTRREGRDAGTGVHDRRMQALQES